MLYLSFARGCLGSTLIVYDFRERNVKSVRVDCRENGQVHGDFARARLLTREVVGKQLP